MRLDAGQFEMIDDAMAEVQRRKTPAERLAVAFGMWRMVRKLLTNVLASQHPEWDEARLRREVARRISNGAV